MTEPLVHLRDLTTFQVGGLAARYVRAADRHSLVQTVTDCDRRGEPVLILSGGSNLLVSDDGFDGTVVHVATRGIEADVSACAGANVKVAAGEPWDGFVAHAVANEWVGIEALSGIPGLVGATPIQNVGAYGQEVAQTIAAVHTFDRERGAYRRFAAADCGFDYRDSVFKRHLGRYLVLDVEFQFRLGTLSAPIRFGELATRLGIEGGQRAETSAVREQVLSIRGSKGMVLSAGDPDTQSAGSFFTNPIVAPDVQLPDGAPAFPTSDGRVKTSAAWLIDHAGFGKGYQKGRAGLSTKHVLALTNRGGASAAEIVALAREIQGGVNEAFGIWLSPEPVLVGLSL